MGRVVEVTELALRDAHQSLLATRMALEDMLPACEDLDNAGFWSIECWGGATFDACIRFLNEDPWERLRTFRKLLPKSRLQMLLRGQNLLGYRHYRAALWIFGFAALTDSLDGTVARWFDAKTELGAFLDPFADKLMLVSAFVVLTMDGDFPPWLFAIVIIRDVIIVFGYFLLSFLIVERIPVRPSYIGKGSTFFQLACVVAALARVGQMSPEYFNYLLYTTAGFTALSGVHYMYRGLEILFNREPGMFE